MVKTPKVPGVAIVGCGGCGAKRANALRGSVAVCADAIEERAQTLARAVSAQHVFADWREAVKHPAAGIVIVSTSNDCLAEIALGAVQAGKHVLVEKPAGRSTRELAPLAEAAAGQKVLVRVGFNHRYHPAMRKARELVNAGEIGELMFIRGRYGHGGRVGYEKEWRMNPAVSGGGELIDQGVHLIDISRMFLGDFQQVSGLAGTFFWAAKADDNAFLTLRAGVGKVAFLHVSCTEWKNLFSFEIYGKIGKIHIEGLGGSYGVERAVFYRMSPRMGPPETQIWEFPGADDSWAVEFNEFLEDIRTGRQPSPGIQDAMAALKVVETVYDQSKTG